MKRYLIFLVAIICTLSFKVNAEQQAKWIYYPGDFDIWLCKELSLKRTERNQAYPTMWRLDPAYGIVVFKKQISLDKPENASIWVDGKYYIQTNKHGIFYDYDPQNFELPAGDYELSVCVENYQTVPSILFKSKSYVSDNTWIANSRNNDDVSASSWIFTEPSLPPSTYKLATTPIEAQTVKNEGDGVLIDFGKNTFAFPVLNGLKGSGQVQLYYGESKEEALAKKLAETYDIITVNNPVAKNDTLPTKAFRYILVVKDPSVSFDKISALYEYLPVEYKGTFSCSDPLINDIYNTSMYTFHLATRECHIDGIKRDRWVWSGDALQSYLMNFYTFFDEDVNTRTLWGLRGHDPVTTHINTILDYSFYWMIGIYYHYLYTGDASFIKQIYPRMLGTMNFCLNRLNENGLAEGLPGDWVFIDWAPIDKEGEVSFEQLLLIQSLKAMMECAEIAQDHATKEKMQKLYDSKKKEFNRIFWSDDKKAFLHSRIDGKLTDYATRYTNMFAILFNMVDQTKKQEIKESVILNDSILQITTPYMKFYELAALCEIGEQAKVLKFVKDYWGGMLERGATTFWEAFDPTAPEDKHYEMYGRPFGKSLCHAWGANPVYLFGRYFLGVYPTASGYKEYIIEPNLGGLKWMKGTVPTPEGVISVEMNTKKIGVTTTANTGGILKFKSKRTPKVNQGTLIKGDNNEYTLKLDKANSYYEVLYK
ncbi:MAG: alpha-L-rhamnosidase C-terminal domain-containing protein [Bacteroidales bacterium]|nr:alpha-L-rhamnosidase C-terminal domain-containing protein [Bacteroidales bacterium]